VTRAFDELPVVLRVRASRRGHTPALGTQAENPLLPPLDFRRYPRLHDLDKVLRKSDSPKGDIRFTVTASKP